MGAMLDLGPSIGRPPGRCHHDLSPRQSRDRRRPLTGTIERRHERTLGPRSDCIDMRPNCAAPRGDPFRINESRPGSGRPQAGSSSSARRPQRHPLSVLGGEGGSLWPEDDACVSRFAVRCCGEVEAETFEHSQSRGVAPDGFCAHRCGPDLSGLIQRCCHRRSSDAPTLGTAMPTTPRSPAGSAGQCEVGVLNRRPVAQQ